MSLKTKKIIKILAQRYKHSICYEGDKMILKSNINYIEITIAKNMVKISYNINQGYGNNELDFINVYDFLIKVLTRYDITEVNENKGFLIQLNDYIKEEGKMVKKSLSKLISDLKNNKIKYRDLGGNRYEGEYIDGVLLLKDDLGLDKSNIIELKKSEIDKLFHLLK